MSFGRIDEESHRAAEVGLVESLRLHFAKLSYIPRSLTARRSMAFIPDLSEDPSFNQMSQQIVVRLPNDNLSHLEDLDTVITGTSLEA